MNDSKIYFSKLRPEAVIPSKREEDGAFDIYACFEQPYLVLRPHETKMIPTGIASAFSSHYAAILKERGSTGTKGLGQRAGVVDSGYRNEWFCPLTNHNTYHIVIAKASVTPDEIAYALTGQPDITVPFKIYPYEKAICQCLMVEVPVLKTEEVDYETLLSFQSERGTGALGSSGK